MDIQTCPRCARALKDTSPLARLAGLASEGAAAVWGHALRLGLDHPCTRYLAVTFPGETDPAWSSDWPGYTGPPDLTRGYPPTAVGEWVEAEPDPHGYDGRPAALAAGLIKA